MRVSWSPSNRQTSTFVALAENSAKLVPLPLHVAPSGQGSPSSTGPAMICPPFCCGDTTSRSAKRCAVRRDFFKLYPTLVSRARCSTPLFRGVMLRRTGTHSHRLRHMGPGSAERHEECRTASGTRLSPPPLVQRGAVEAVDAAGVAFEHFCAVALGQRQRVDVEFCVVIITAGERIDAAHRADHFRRKQDVVDRHHLEQYLDAGLVI